MTNSKAYHKQYYELHKQKSRDSVYRGLLNQPQRCWARYALISHKRRGHLVTISISDLETLAKKTTHCLYCDCELDWVYGSKGYGPNPNSPSLDRINNEVELRLGNVEIICNRCNARKYSSTKQELIDWCRKVTDKFKDLSNLKLPNEKEDK